MNRKSELRNLIREKLDAISPARLVEKSAAICKHILQFPQWRDARVVAIFAAQSAEPDLAPLWDESAGRTFCYPRVNGVQLDLIAVDDPAALQNSRWQLREPLHDEAKIIAAENFDLIFVPGLAFAADGARLGRGGGFYDRLLATPKLRALKIGVCFDAQISPEIPREPHDCSIDALITESGQIRNPQSEIRN